MVLAIELIWASVHKTMTIFSRKIIETQIRVCLSFSCHDMIMATEIILPASKQTRASP